MSGVEDYLNGLNSSYLEALYKACVNDPTLMDALPDDMKSLLTNKQDSYVENTSPQANGHDSSLQTPPPLTSLPLNDSVLQEILKTYQLIHAYRVRGHLMANLDPLGLTLPIPQPELDPKTYGFSEEDMSKNIYIDKTFGGDYYAKLSFIVEHLKKAYCGSIGVEFMHIQDSSQRAWIQQRFEQSTESLSLEEKKFILKKLIEVDTFEKFLNTKFPGAKRFSIEGADSLVPCIEIILQKAVNDGMKEAIFGMAHRGRLSVLSQVLHKPLEELFSQFQGLVNVEIGSGDVKYHLGFSNDRDIEASDGPHPLHLSLTSNPSHLEAVNPVALGKVRAKQTLSSLDSVLGILIHGDASFSGQGLVAESLSLSQLDGYKTGGTIHIIVNNQIGFTTNPSNSRSSPYSSDIAKMIQSPIFHVNADDPEAVARVTKIASDFRKIFHKDVVIDMVCYRRHGHNEGDEPMFTQPKMYKKIDELPTTGAIYGEKLSQENITTKEEMDSIRESYKKILEDHFAKASAADFKIEPEWLKGRWAKIQAPIMDDNAPDAPLATGLPKEKITYYINALTTIPSQFNLNSKVARQLDTKRKKVEEDQGIDWATAEALAFASLLDEDHPVRLSGQDVGRGTFSHRHAVWVDQENEHRYSPLNHIKENQPTFQVIDSPLAEASVLGFEYGYAQADPNCLVLWEAQFGDFANGAQVIIDQFVSSGETKWLRLSGLTMLLPHGYEGQGPEHSSARLERYLQLCAQHNMRVLNCTLPSNYFHALRRQIYHPSRKPLIVMSPKSLLRHPKAISYVAEFTDNTGFQPVLTTLCAPQESIERVILCSGKVYYDILAKVENKPVAIIRLEELYPFPTKALKEALEPFSKLPWVWCQEEPQNMGAFWFVHQHIKDILTTFELSWSHLGYAGRKAAASPATGSAKRHEKEQEELVNHALEGNITE